MKSLEKSIDQEISTKATPKTTLWPLVGPLLLLASLTLLFVHFPERALVFAFVVFLSLALCWQLTWRGVAISIALLASGLGYHYGSMELRELLWHLGMSSALVLGFVATALTSEETTERLAALFPSPQTANREEVHIKQLADQAKTIKGLEEQIQSQREAFSQKQERVLGLEQLLDTAREELKSSMLEQEQRQGELHQQRQRAERAQEQMAEAREEVRYLAEELKNQKESDGATIHHLKNLLEHKNAAQQLEVEKLTQDLRASKTQAEGQVRRIAFLDEEKQAMQREWERERSEALQQVTQLEAIEERFKQELEQKQGLIESLLQATSRVAQFEAIEARFKQDLEQKRGLIEALEQELAQKHQLSEVHLSKAKALELEKSALQQALEKANQELQQLPLLQTSQVESDLLKQNLEVAEAQKIAHWRAMRTAEGKYQQLREQFEEKAAQLDETRRQRFFAEEQVEKLNRELEEWTAYGRFYPEKPLVKHMQRMEREQTATLALMQREIDSLQGLIAHLFKQN